MYDYRYRFTQVDVNKSSTLTPSLRCPQSMEALEYEVRALHGALEQVQTTLTSPELARQSLKEQLIQRQVTMETGSPTKLALVSSAPS